MLQELINYLDINPQAVEAKITAKVVRRERVKREVKAAQHRRQQLVKERVTEENQCIEPFDLKNDEFSEKQRPNCLKKQKTIWMATRTIAMY